MALAREQGGIITGVVMAPQIIVGFGMLAKQAGIYALGGPANMNVARIWGAPIIETSYIATARDEIAIAGDFPAGRVSEYVRIYHWKSTAGIWTTSAGPCWPTAGRWYLRWTCAARSTSARLPD